MTIDDLLREASDDVERAVADLDHPVTQPRSRRPAWVMFAGAAAVAVIAVSLPYLVRMVGEPAPSTPAGEVATTTSTVVDGDQPSQVVLDYWALEGTLDSVGNEPGWLCPPKSNGGFTSTVPEDEMPTELSLSLAGTPPVAVYNRDSGPTCGQPPMVVLIATDDPGPGTSSTTAGIAMWPRTTRFEDGCLEGCRFDGGPVETPEINGRPARLQLHTETGHYDVWWYDASGTPMYAETSGLDEGQVRDLIANTTVDPQTHRATLDPGVVGVDFEVAVDQPSVGVWESGYWRAVEYDIDGTSILVSTTSDVSFDPYARFASYVEYLTLTHVDEALAVWAPEAGNFLSYETGDGVTVSIEGAQTLDQAIAIASNLD